MVRQHGAAAGNLILRACAQFFTAAVRDMDLVVRYDADVFGIELPGATLSDAVKVAHRLKTQMQTCPLQIQGEKIAWHVSIGVAEAQPGDDLAALAGRVEKAQAAAELDTANQIHLHNGVAVESSAVESAKLQSGAVQSIAANSGVRLTI